MDDLLEEAGPGRNVPELTVSELAGRIRRSLETGFPHVRVRGELGRVSRPASGHVYLDLKDERAVLAAVIWRGTAQALRVKPEEGLDVVATGRLTTFPGQSRYQLVIEDLALAGLGALMALLERRKAALAAEGLFDPARKKPIPFLPEVIGVVTSPTGAVIRDILHRLRERFPRRVIVWPVTVQGERCAAEVAAAIRGFNALAPGGAIPRPDLLIVARGGGSVEDLWGFNEEIVVRAAAESRIPLIAAVGHETDTTLIDLAADLRAPTPTAAAERAVPVRAELLAALAGLEDRRRRAASRLLGEGRRRLGDLGRLLPRPEALLAERTQRLDDLALRLPRALAALVQSRRLALRQGRAGEFGPRLLALDLAARRARFSAGPAGRLAPPLLALALARQRGALDRLGARLAAAPLRAAAAAGRERLGWLAGRMARAWAGAAAARASRLESAAGLLRSLGYAETLARGFAVVRDGAGRPLSDAAAAARQPALVIEFRDGRLHAAPAAPAPPARAPGPRRRRPEGDPQGRLL